MKNVDALKLVLERYIGSESCFSDWHNKYKDSRYRAYRGVPDDKKNPYRNQVYDKITYTICEVVASRMMQTVFQSRPIISILPQEGADTELADQVQKVLANLLENPSAEFFLEMMDFFKQCAIAGTSFLKVTPDFVLKDGELVFKGFRFETIDYMNAFPDPNARRNSRARFFIERQIVSWDDLKEGEKAKLWKNVDDVKGCHENWDVVSDRLTNLGIGTSRSMYDPETGQVELLHHYSNGDIITVAGRTTVIRDTREESGKNARRVMPYATPIIDVRYCAVPREYMGIGVPEQLEQDQEFTNLLRSATLDNLELLVNKLFTMKVGGATLPRDVRSAPGQIIPVGERGDVEELQISDISQSVFKILEGLDKKTQDVTGEFEYGRGAAPDRKETLGGIVKLQEATLGRFDITTKMFEFAGVRMVGQKCIEIMRRFMPKEMFMRILGDKYEDTKFFDTDIDDLLNQYDIAPVGSTVTANQALKAEQAMQGWSIGSAIPPEVLQANGIEIDLYELLYNVYTSINTKNIDKVVKRIPKPSPPEQPPQLPMGMGQAQGMAPMGELNG